jgi:hypothetical protein
LILLEGIIATNDEEQEEFCKIKMYCDNKALVGVINKHRKQNLTMKEYYKADVDIELQILSQLLKLEAAGVSISIHHVKGHQDKTIPFHKLSRPAQLNTIADKMATNALQDPAPKYSEFPATSVYVTINYTYTTSNIAKTWRKAHLSQDLRQYLIKKYKWKPNVPDHIWWKLVEPVIRKYKENDKIRINKILYERLPHNHNNNKIDNEIEDKCKQCDEEYEDTDHIIRCKSSNRQIMRDTMMRDISTICEKYACRETIGQAMNLGLNAWLNNETVPDIKKELPNATNNIIKAYNEQSEIGWNQIFRGRISMQWGYIVNTSIEHSKDKQNKTKNMAAEMWGREVLTTVFNTILEMWAERNKIEHGATKQESTGILKQKLLQKVRKHKEDSPYHNTRDEEYRNTPIEQLEQMPSCQIMAWLRNMATLRKIHIAHLRAEKEKMRNRDEVIPDILYVGRRDVRSGLYTPTLQHGSRRISQ